MNDPDEIKLKAEIDKISHNIDDIMKKIESVQPLKQEEDAAEGEGPTSE
ncbi:MAG: hypothetical protein GY859_02750 [Desulfobacterales bacterium]|nr:hypothetical protein [Desulfobacterales bacterium]